MHPRTAHVHERTSPMIRIRTTHVGSLPRSQLVADLLFAREKGCRSTAPPTTG